MRGISEEILRKIQQSMFAREKGREAELRLLTILIDECKELQEPWIPLDEFLKSGFEGLCWVFTEDSKAILLEFIGDGFFDIADHFRIHHKTITHVMPIHKPEPPR